MVREKIIIIIRFAQQMLGESICQIMNLEMFYPMKFFC